MIKLLVKQMFSMQEYEVTIEKNSYITIECTYKNAHHPKHTKNTLRVGDMAEYDSYNLYYTDRIKSITDKTVTFENGRRLRLEEFCWRNWDFNLDEVEKKNQETMMVI
jgi:hypothetical protein